MGKILAVNIALYIVICTGLYLVCEGSIRVLVNAIRTGVRLRKRLDKDRGNSLFVKADRLVRAALGIANGGSKLIMLVGVIFMAAFISAKPYLGIAASLFMSCMAGLMPVLVLKLKLAEKRNAGSAEGEAFIAEMITAYKMADCRIDIALETVVRGEKNKGIKVCRRLCEDVLSSIREAGSREKLLNCAEGFSYGIGTKWAELTAYAIGITAADGIDISASLEDVMMQLREARSIAEERRRLNGEAARIVVFMVPVAYVVTLFFSVNLLGVGIKDIVRNQFCTTAGLVLLFGIIFVFVVNLLLISALRHTQFDF